MRPKCKDINNKVVRLHTDCKTNGGEKYYAGEYLVCTKMDKNGRMNLKRVGAGLIIQYDQAIEIIGDRKEIFGA